MIAQQIKNHDYNICKTITQCTHDFHFIDRIPRPSHTGGEKETNSQANTTSLFFYTYTFVGSTLDSCTILSPARCSKVRMVSGELTVSVNKIHVYEGRGYWSYDTMWHTVKSSNRVFLLFGEAFPSACVCVCVCVCVRACACEPDQSQRVGQLERLQTQTCNLLPGI